MALFRDALRWAKGPEVSVPETRYLNRAAGRVRRDFLELVGEVADPTDVAEARSAMLEAVGQDRSLGSLPRRTRRMLSWAMFSPLEQPPEWPAQDPHVEREFRAWIASSTRPRDSASLVRVLLIALPPDNPLFERWLPVLNEALDRHGDSVVLRELRDVIRGRSLLSPDGIQRLAGEWSGTATDKEFMRFIEDSGLTVVPRDSWIFRQLALATLDTIRRLLSERSLDSTRLLRLLAATEDMNTGKRLHGLKPAVAYSLLEPFANSDPPSDGLRDTVTSTVIHDISDPRFNSNPWRAIERQHAHLPQILKRLLIRSSMEDFFDLIGMVADNVDMWQERRAFWERYLNAGVITDAWPVLGSETLRAAHTFRPKLVGAAASMGSGASPSHSVILMRIRNELTVAEWSHNGACRLWVDEGVCEAPRFYKEHYSVYALRPPRGEAGVKYVRHAGSWQQTIRRAIHRHTGVKI